MPLIVVQASTFSVVGWLALSGRLVRPRGEAKSLVAVIGMVVGAVVLSTIFSEDLDASVPAMLEWLWLGGLALLAIHVARHPRLRELLVALLAAAVFMQILWGHFVWWGGSDPSRSQVGTFYAANQYAGYVLLLATVFLGICYSKERLGGAVAFGALGAAGYLAVGFSGSRGGMVAASLGLLATTWFGAKLFGKRVFARLAGVLLFVVLGGWALTSSAIFPEPAVERGPLASLQSRHDVGSSIEMRLRWAQGAFLIGVSDPFTGSGPGTFGDKFFQTQDPSWHWSKFAHNHYLESLAEGGLLLLAGVVALSLSPVLLGWARVKGTLGPEQGWRLGLWGGLVGAAVHLGVDHDWSYPGFGAAFIIAAMLVVHRAGAVTALREGRMWDRAIGAVAVSALLATLAIVGSRALLSGVNLVEVDALSRAEKAAVVAPHSTEPRIAAAHELLRRNSPAHFRKAVDHLRTAGFLDRLDPEIRWRRAEAHTLLEEWDAARSAYLEALLIVPNAPDAYLRYASFEIRMDNEEAARQILQVGISRLSTSTEGSDSLRAFMRGLH